MFFNKKRVFASILTSIFLLSMSTNTYAENDDIKITTDSPVWELVKNEEAENNESNFELRTVKLYDSEQDEVLVQGEPDPDVIRKVMDDTPTDFNILKKAGLDPYTKKPFENESNTLLKESVSEMEFGGLYIDDERGEVIIQYKFGNDLTKSISDNAKINRLFEKSVKSFNSSIELYENEEFKVTIKSVDYSYDELKKINDFAGDNFEELYNNYNLNYCALDVKNNAVKIEFIDTEDVELQKQKVIGFINESIPEPHEDYYNNMIICDYGEEYETYVPSLSMGDAVNIRANNYFTIGYPYDDGFITCGHGLDTLSIKAPIYQGRSSTSIIGKRTYANNSSTKDYGFVTITDANFRNPYDLVHAMSVPSVGARVVFGGASTGSKACRITDNDVSVVVGGLTRLHFIETDARSEAGDSGAPLFEDNLDEDTRTIHGILCGGGGSRTFYTPRHKIDW